MPVCGTATLLGHAERTASACALWAPCSRFAAHTLGRILGSLARLMVCSPSSQPRVAPWLRACKCVGGWVKMDSLGAGRTRPATARNHHNNQPSRRQLQEPGRSYRHEPNTITVDLLNRHNNQTHSQTHSLHVTPKVQTHAESSRMLCIHELYAVYTRAVFAAVLRDVVV